jgi:single-strand DNA-binding protein
MSHLNTTVITGNLTQDPTLRETATGVPVAHFPVAVTHRVFRQGAWADLPTVYKDVVVWRGTARNVAATLTAGMRVTVVGYEVDASYTPQGGDRKVVRTATEAEEVSVSIRFATATVTKNTPRTRNPEPAPAG